AKDQAERAKSLSEHASAQSEDALKKAEKALAGPQSWFNQLAIGRLATALLGFVIGLILFWYGTTSGWFDDMWLSDWEVIILGAFIMALVLALFFGDLLGLRRTSSSDDERNKNSDAK